MFLNCHLKTSLSYEVKSKPPNENYRQSSTLEIERRKGHLQPRGAADEDGVTPPLLPFPPPLPPSHLPRQYEKFVEEINQMKK